jgi:hypothetical protein
MRLSKGLDVRCSIFIWTFERYGWMTLSRCMSE